MTKTCALCLCAFAACPCLAANPATVKEYEKTFTTYPFSDPDPIPTLGEIYPYFRFDGYTDKAVQKSWKVVELENDYLRVLILPEIGGKVWTAVEKSTGRPFIYYNHTVKFRELSLRGPWTGGGIEANYGVMGHTANCATPVDYLVRANPDGSASCTIGALDLLTRTPWRLEINLPKDKAYFTTASFWHNATPLEQPYYSWMNAGIKAAGNLQLIFPGTRYLGHAGEYGDWPINKKNGRNVSNYEQNDFGGYKSYHVFGLYADFFGAYWHDDDFGMAHCASHDDKPGKKIWIWGLSQSGMIWEKLLTDSDGQYVEVQAGRPFNQAGETSTLTPFKHRGFAPYATDTWTEYWFPVKRTKGFVAASPYGALNVKQEADRLKIWFCPVQAIDDKLEIFDGGRPIYSRQLAMKPLELFSDELPQTVSEKGLRVTLGGHKLRYSADPQADLLARPLDAPQDFGWKTVYGLYLQGKEQVRQRHYRTAVKAFRQCLRKDGNYLPALVETALLRYRGMDYAGALQFARKALSIDTYEPAANYCYGLANKALGHWADAKDGFDLASQSIEYRSAAFTELAELYLREKDFDKAAQYAGYSLDYNRGNLAARQVGAVAFRLQGDGAKADAELKRMLAIDPLNHFARFEKYLRGAVGKEEFTGPIRNDLPQETFLELAAWYHGLGLANDAAVVLGLAPRNAEVLYWLAYLKQDARLIEEANAATPDFVFPFRAETAETLRWAIGQSAAWQPKYYLALIYWDRDDLSRAKELFSDCGNRPDYAPFYAARAALLPDTASIDLKRAVALDPRQWRYGLLLANHYFAQDQYAAALDTARTYARRFPANSVLGKLHAAALLFCRQYQESSDVLDRLDILPHEGENEGHDLYREAKLMLAVEQLKSKNYDKALACVDAARLWPENLGVGKPYQEDIDERLEDWLAAKCHEGLRDAAAKRNALDKIVRFKPKEHGIADLLTAWALEQTGKADQGRKLLASWLEKERLAPRLLGQPSMEPLARWCVAAFGQTGGGLPERLQDVHYRVIQALQPSDLR